VRARAAQQWHAGAELLNADGIPALVVTSVATGDRGALVDLLPERDPLAWVHLGDGLVGWGVAARLQASGANRFRDADRWWRELVARADVTDGVGAFGSGLVGFGSFGFADRPGSSVLVVPRIVVGRRDGTSWVTTVRAASAPALRPEALRTAVRPPCEVVFTDGALSSPAWASAVAAAVARIADTDLEKVVLARDLVVSTGEPLDARWPLTRLAERYPSCWTFCVDGLFGATPEMLVRRHRGLVTSRVLAGTIRRTGNDERDLMLAASLARSSKDLEEHEYAVRSVAEVLASHCSSMSVPETPFVLHLPNVMHLATDVAGRIDSDTTALGLAEALHPSAAVGGTPTTLALAAIDELEGMSRDRYAGPVGWLDAAGDGEWGIALRCGLVDGDQVRLFAGCGIVADSDPETELVEAQAKFVPVRDALEG
jgi:menaquinone-specific isochorismate synthase